MGKSAFKLPPISPLIGSNLKTFNKIVYGKYIDPKYRLKVFLSRMIVSILSPLRWYEENVFSKKIDINTEEMNPLFILGHWRSGTTFLHNILCKDPNTAFVTTYQTVFANYLNSQGFLKPLMRYVMPTRRPGDNVKLSVDYPQEEEFAITNTTDQSFYNFFYFPRHVGDYYNKYVRFEITETNFKQFQDSYTKILKRAMFNSSPATRLVIKNPVNTARITFLKDTFPHADFIHIYRNPYIVYLSTKRFFTELFPTLWLQKISHNQMHEMIIDLYLNLYDDFFNALEKHPDLNILEIKYEDFEKDPLPIINEIYSRFYEKDFDTVKSNFVDYIEDQKSHSTSSYVISQVEYDIVSSKWSRYINKWNYDLPSNVKIV
jgi:hypothetical protein